VRPKGFPHGTLTAKVRATVPAVGDTVTFGVRPEHFIEAREGMPHLVATSRVVEQLGGVSYVYATGSDDVQITVQEKGHSRTATGAEIRIGIDPETILLFDKDGKRL
jgi:lactose/L-arabinose transport system ATP-binding protein